jgi:hypothetical protein
MAEHPAVNRRVVSSSLTCGANYLNEKGTRCPFSFEQSATANATLPRVSDCADELSLCARRVFFRVHLSKIASARKAA